MATIDITYRPAFRVLWPMRRPDHGDPPASMNQRTASAPWRSITPIGTITRSRNGVAAETYELYRVVAATDMVRLPSAR